jgi:hypothetical protein
MLSIQFPEPNFRLKKEKEKDFIFDPLRKKWLLLTPEEWVRQNFVQYLVQELNYPADLIAQEKVLQLGELKKRFDILVYDKQHRPWMMIECKAPEIKLDEGVLQQVLRYHISIPVGFLVITNGQSSYGWEKKGMNLHLLAQMPEWI